MSTTTIRGGTVVDGAGGPAVRADVVVEGGRVAEVGRPVRRRADDAVDAAGMVVAPGFIDLHAHSDLAVLVDGAHEAKTLQGVTTEVVGQDGLGYAPAPSGVLADLRERLAGWNGRGEGLDWAWRSVTDYLDRVDAVGAACNVACLVPHGTLRMAVMGDDARPAGPDELAEMRAWLARGLADGAAGLSTGLTYPPAMHADDDELVALCSVLAEHGGCFAPHTRDYGKHALAAYRDVVEIGRRSGAPVHLTHAHVSYPVNRGRAGELLAMVDAARAEGHDVTLDSYPYLAGATSLHALLPAWAHAGGVDAAVARLRDPELREPLRREVEETGHATYHNLPIDWSTVVVAGVRRPEHAAMAGRSVADLAEEAGRPATDLVCDLLVDERLEVTCVHHVGDEGNVREVMRHPAHSAGSDGILEGDRPHPRGWGTFARYLGGYVREEGVLRLEEAVRKLTASAAQRIGAWDRGLVRPGMAADLVVFDAAAIIDRATYEEPRRPPDGIAHVLVNGQPVVRDGARTGGRPGRALRRGAA